VRWVLSTNDWFVNGYDLDLKRFHKLDLRHVILKQINMIELFQMGGVLFMSILSLELLIALVFAVRYFAGKDEKYLSYMKSAGLLAAVTGVLGQTIGLYSAFEYIEQVGSVSPQMLAGGIKVSSITTMYGLVIYLVALGLSMTARFIVKPN
jgi:hypothetical protein